MWSKESSPETPAVMNHHPHVHLVLLEYRDSLHSGFSLSWILCSCWRICLSPHRSSPASSVCCNGCNAWSPSPCEPRKTCTTKPVPTSWWFLQLTPSSHVKGQKTRGVSPATEPVWWLSSKVPAESVAQHSAFSEQLPGIFSLGDAKQVLCNEPPVMQTKRPIHTFKRSRATTMHGKALGSLATPSWWGSHHTGCWARRLVSTHLKNISQIGSFPQVGVKKNIWNHHLIVPCEIPQPFFREPWFVFFQQSSAILHPRKPQLDSCSTSIQIQYEKHQKCWKIKCWKLQYKTLTPTPK